MEKFRQENTPKMSKSFEVKQILSQWIEFQKSWMKRNTPEGREKRLLFDPPPRSCETTLLEIIEYNGLKW